MILYLQMAKTAETNFIETHIKLTELEKKITMEQQKLRGVEVKLASVMYLVRQRDALIRGLEVLQQDKKYTKVKADRILKAIEKKRAISVVQSQELEVSFENAMSLVSDEMLSQMDMFEEGESVRKEEESRCAEDGVKKEDGEKEDGGKEDGEKDEGEKEEGEKEEGEKEEGEKEDRGKGVSNNGKRPLEEIYFPEAKRQELV